MAHISATILGIDPGTRRTGWGVIRKSEGKLTFVAGGTIVPSTKAIMAERLTTIYDELTLLIADYDPDVVVVEESFGGVNPKTTIALGQARGVILVAAHRGGRKIAEYAPRAVKKAVVGTGRAEKSQVQFMVKSILALPEIPASEDEADALALAICHANEDIIERISPDSAPLTKAQKQLQALGLLK